MSSETAQLPVVLSIGAVAKRFGVPSWQVRNLYKRQLLPEPLRLGPYRAVLAADLPRIKEALERAGYLKTKD
jgi:hypothetical protein